MGLVASPNPWSKEIIVSAHIWSAYSKEIN